MATNRLNGSGALNYMGVNAPQPPNLIVMDRTPSVTDGIGMPLGTLWLLPQEQSGVTPQQEVFMLVGAYQNIFTWKHLRGSAGPPSNPFAVNTIVYSTPGSYTYTPTSGLVSAVVECVGGGGGTASYGMKSGDMYSGGVTGQPAGGGAYCKKTLTSTQIGASQTVVVGQGGQSPAAGCVVDTMTGYTCVNAAQSGQASSFGSFMSAGGGQAETDTFPFAGLGGIATGGDINISGEDGQMLGLPYTSIPNIYTDYSSVAYPILGLTYRSGLPYPFVAVNAISGENVYTSIGVGKGGNSGLSYGLGACKSSITFVAFSYSPDGGYIVGVNGGSYGGGANASWGTIGVNSAHTYLVPGASGGDGVVIITEYF